MSLPRITLLDDETMPIPKMSFQATSLSKISNSDTLPSSRMPVLPPGSPGRCALTITLFP